MSSKPAGNNSRQLESIQQHQIQQNQCPGHIQGDQGLYVVDLNLSQQQLLGSGDISLDQSLIHQNLPQQPAIARINSQIPEMLQSQLVLPLVNGNQGGYLPQLQKNNSTNSKNLGSQFTPVIQQNQAKQIDLSSIIE